MSYELGRPPFSANPVFSFMSEYTIWASVAFYRSSKRFDISQDSMQDFHKQLSAAKPVPEVSCALAHNELSNGAGEG
jgi:hypothetical protein